MDNGGHSAIPEALDTRAAESEVEQNSDDDNQTDD